MSAWLPCRILLGRWFPKCGLTGRAPGGNFNFYVLPLLRLSVAFYFDLNVTNGRSDGDGAAFIQLSDLSVQT